jgi:hypothetical protein
VGAIHTVSGVPADAAPGDLHHQQHRVVELPAPQDHQNRGHFPNDEAVIKLLWLAICSIEDKLARDRAKEAGLGRGAKRTAQGHLVEGQTTTSWKQALAQLALVYPDRINPHL